MNGTEQSATTPKIFVGMDNGEFMELNMAIPLQILFDDVITYKNIRWLIWKPAKNFSRFSFCYINW